MAMNLGINNCGFSEDTPVTYPIDKLRLSNVNVTPKNLLKTHNDNITIQVSPWCTPTSCRKLHVSLNPLFLQQL